MQATLSSGRPSPGGAGGPATGKPPEVDLYLAEFSALWQEVLVRLQVRERAAVFSITVEGVLLGAGLGVPPFNQLTPPPGFRREDILLLAPIAAFFLEAMLLRQTVRIAMIATYVGTELNRKMDAALTKAQAGSPGDRKLAWLDFAGQFGGGRTWDAILSTVELSAPLLLALFNLLVHALISAPLNTWISVPQVRFALAAWGLTAMLTALVGWRSFLGHRLRLIGAH